MNVSLNKLLEKTSTGEGQIRENLNIVPLFITEGEEEFFPYLLLEEALEMGHIEVKELTQEGDVNTIIITNNAAEPVLILYGEEILGAKQNRMVNATILLYPQKKTEVPVSCVERGRWRYSSPVFDKAGNFGYNTLRRQKAEQVSHSLKYSQSYAADQGAIWQEIDRKQASMGTSSPTDALPKSTRTTTKNCKNSWKASTHCRSRPVSPCSLTTVSPVWTS